MGEHWKRFETKHFNVSQIVAIDRIIDPTQARIDAMKESMSGTVGQIEPILIAKHLYSSWKVIAGATRLAAAKELGWKQIEATVIAADNDFEYRLIEIIENLDRHDLSADERASLRRQEKQLRADRLAYFDEIASHPAKVHEPAPPPAKAKPHRATGKPTGRPQGGTRKAARESGVPKSTAHDHMQKKGGISPGLDFPGKIPPAPKMKKCPTCGGTGKVKS